jgi:hypothetical protein
MARKSKRRSSIVEIGTGPARVRIYTIKRKDGYDQFTLAWKEGGIRRTRCLSSMDEARMIAQQITVRLINRGCVTDEATKRDIELLRHCERAAGEFGVTLSAAIDEWTNARRAAGETSLAEAIRFHQANRRDIPVIVQVVNINFPGPDRGPDEELERVEGGYGMSAAEHYHALRGMIPDLRGLVIHDNDGKQHRESNQAALEIRVWKRYEPENYFITPELLLAWADKHMPGEDLFSQTRQRLLDVLILEQVFDGSAEDFANYQKLDASTRRTLWRAQTQFKKLSLFAEEFFRRLANEAGTRMLARKGDLHELVALCDPTELNGEVREKLDAMQRLLS